MAHCLVYTASMVWRVGTLCYYCLTTNVPSSCQNVQCFCLDSSWISTFKRLHYRCFAVFEPSKGSRKLSDKSVQQYRVLHRIRSKQPIDPSERKSQILLVHCNHWVMVSNDHDGLINEVQIFDSNNSKPESDCRFPHQVAAVFAFEQESFTTETVPVQQQSDGTSCGLYCLGWLLAKAMNEDPCRLNLSQKVDLLWNELQSQVNPLWPCCRRCGPICWTAWSTINSTALSLKPTWAPENAELVRSSLYPSNAFAECLHWVTLNQLFSAAQHCLYARKCFICRAWNPICNKPTLTAGFVPTACLEDP